MPFYNWTEMERSAIAPHYSTAEGPTGNIEVGRYRFAAGTGAKPHQHPQEQVITRSTRPGPWTGRPKS